MEITRLTSQHGPGRVTRSKSSLNVGSLWTTHDIARQYWQTQTSWFGMGMSLNKNMSNCAQPLEKKRFSRKTWTPSQIEKMYCITSRKIKTYIFGWTLFINYKFEQFEFTSSNGQTFSYLWRATSRKLKGD